MQVKDGNVTAMNIFLRHYTARANRKIYQMVGPGEKMLLLTPDARALFVWRKFVDDCIPKQHGVNCAVFRREGTGGGMRPSDLIRAADEIAWERWPGERLYTYVDPKKVKSKNPGYCFLCAGYKRAGHTKGGLLILEKLP